MTSASKTETLHRTPELVGTTFRETVTVDDGSTELRGGVTAYSPNQVMAFHPEGWYGDVDV